MPEYLVHWTETRHCSMVVEADNEDDAADDLHDDGSYEVKYENVTVAIKVEPTSGSPYQTP